MPLTSKPRYPCDDCGFDCCPLDGPDEYYVVNDDVWTSIGGKAGTSRTHDFNLTLCIGCLESRLGRRLRVEDFEAARPANMLSPWHTDRLNDRLGWDRLRWARYMPPDWAMNDD